jgi:membrane fusion protein, multidrug efflux system
VATLERQSSVIAQAQATVAADRAEVAFAEHELNRYNHLAGVGAGTVQNAQQARTRIDQATARLANATAVLAAERKQVEILTAQRDAAEGGLETRPGGAGNGQLSAVLHAHCRAGGWHGR